MKTKLLKALVLKNKQRGGVALLSFVCLLSFAITPGSAQLLKQKRITALRLGDAAEGSRVTIVSDSALTDYEAFRRGDRFYVKIPLAEFKSVLTHCCANGFEDVQVQRVGDSLIVSFRLQPGATARVDQRSNRLDVIFFSPNRTFRNNTANAASNRVATGTNVSRISQNRGPDAAGPMPPGSAPAFRPRVVTERARAANESRAPQNRRVQPNPHTNSNRGANKQSTSGNSQTTRGKNQPPSGNNQSSAVKNQSTTSNAAIELPSPVTAQSPISTPSTSASYPALTTATPAASLSSQPAISSSTSSGSPGFLNWKTRGKAALQWVSANRLATLLGALILLSLIFYLATALRRRRKKLIAAKRVNASKVQPKHSSGADFDELLSADPGTSPASSNLPKEFAKKPAIASAVAAATPQNHSWVLTKPSVASPSAGHEHSSDEEEREVFEL